MNNKVNWYDYDKQEVIKGRLPSAGGSVHYTTSFFTLKPFNSGTCKIIAYYIDKVLMDCNGVVVVINLEVITFKPLNYDQFNTKIAPPDWDVDSGIKYKWEK